MDKTHMQDNELLSAYIDGELAADDAARLAERLAIEPELMRRLEAMRSGDAAVRAVYAKLDETPLPDSVSRMLDSQREEATTGRVVALTRRAKPRFFSLPVAIAASVALIAGFLALRQPPVVPQLDAVDALVAGQLDAGGEIQDFLERGMSGQLQSLGDAAQMQVVLSFERDGGGFCRQLYVAATDRSVHGVACRGPSGWQLEAVATGDAGATGGQFQPASGSIPEAVSRRVDALIGARDVLSTEEEKTAISSGWRKVTD